MCTSPNKVFYWYDKGEKFTKFTYGFNNIDHLEIYQDGHVRYVTNENRGLHAHKIVSDFDHVPCGKCEECKINRAMHKTHRMIMETKTQGSENCWFVTFTYDDMHLPSEDYIDSDGVYKTAHSINKRDMQLFVKRLRKHLFGNQKGNLRYVICGEYGDTFGRPHYHGIFWNLPLDDIRLDSFTTQTGREQYISPLLDKLWHYNGRVRLCPCSINTLGYTARYVQKKLYGDDAWLYRKKHLDPPFILQSQGIGKDFMLLKHDTFISQGFVPTSLNGEYVELFPDRYLEKLSKKNCLTTEDDWNIIKARRKQLAENSLAFELKQTNMATRPEEYLSKKNMSVVSKHSSLKRNGI